MDTGQVELVGRAALEAELVRSGLEVAHPNRDLGIDLLVYTTDPGKPFRALPVQMKVTTGPRFSVDRKYERFEGLVLAYVWLLEAPRFFLMTYREALLVLGAAAQATASWQERGYYTQAPVSRERMGQLEEYENRWRWLHEQLDRSRASSAIEDVRRTP